MSYETNYERSKTIWVSCLQESREQAAAEEDDKSMTYQEIETDIYGDTNAFKVTSDYALKFKLKGKDDGETIEK